MLYRLLLVSTVICAIIAGSSTRYKVNRRCRVTDDLGRIPWLAANSTFHNLGFPLIRSLCDTSFLESSAFESLGCAGRHRMEFIHESVRCLRSSNRSSTIIVDPHMMQTLNIASSGSYVILAMFGILFDLGYNPAVRHWSEAMNELFPLHVATAAMEVSRRYDAYTHGLAENPFAYSPNYVMLQVECPYDFKTSVPVNTSPYSRTFQWMIGLHFSHKHFLYQASDPTAHCIGANFFLGRGRMCSNSGVIPCPQYDFHRVRSLEVTADSRPKLKQNIILYDDDQEEIDMERLKEDVIKLGGLDDLQVLLNKGRKKTDMPDLYKQVKMTIDCRNPGVEFINYEATLYDVLTLSCNMRATRNVFDFPVPSKYHIDTQNWTQLVNLVHDSLVHYEQRIYDFKHFKSLSRRSTELARSQVDIHYFSRDVMFRTYCGSYAECRRVYPWAVAVWTLYPLAMIEVVSEVDLKQEALDNDLIRQTLSELFTSKYFRIYPSIAGVAPVDRFPRTSCAYMVYMDASFIPFGRDFLNTHVAALMKDPRPIMYWQDNKLAIAVMHARPYLRMSHDVDGGNKVYVETDFTSRPIGNLATYHDLLKLCDVAERVEGKYFFDDQLGDLFFQEHLVELHRRHPPLPSVPCDLTHVHITFTASDGMATTSASDSVQKRSILRDQVNSTPDHRCAPPENLIIDALYVPMPLVGDNTDSSLNRSSEPEFWLLSSLLPVPFSTVFDTFTDAQIKTIVQHLDPVLQNANMQKILSFIPSDISDALRLFDAFLYPDVVSLRDMEYPHWGENCS